MTKPIKAFIIASILLNLLLIGIFFGYESRHFMRHDRFSQEIAKQLPAEKYKLYQETMERGKDANRNVRDKLREARKRSVSLLKAEPFNRQAYLAEMKNMQSLRAELMAQMAKSVADLAEQFSPEERAILADTFRRPGGHEQRKACDDK
jgi:uncharacterized membrane protein